MLLDNVEVDTLNPKLEDKLASLLVEITVENLEEVSTMLVTMVLFDILVIDGVTDVRLTLVDGRLDHVG